MEHSYSIHHENLEGEGGLLEQKCILSILCLIIYLQHCSSPTLFIEAEAVLQWCAQEIMACSYRGSLKQLIGALLWRLLCEFWRRVRSSCPKMYIEHPVLNHLFPALLIFSAFHKGLQLSFNGDFGRTWPVHIAVLWKSPLEHSYRIYHESLGGVRSTSVNIYPEHPVIDRLSPTLIISSPFHKEPQPTFSCDLRRVWPFHIDVLYNSPMEHSYHICEENSA